MKIGVGYTYLNRYSVPVKIVDTIESTSHPFMGSNGMSYTESGRIIDDDNVHYDDLVKLDDELEYVPDNVNHPKHYNSHPSGVECIQIVEHMNFCLGNAVKYIWRASRKGNQLEDLKKALFYIKREVERLEKQ